LKSFTRVLIAACLGTAAALAQTPAVASGGVLNAASFATGQAVPAGALVSIFGTNLASSTTSSTTIPLSMSLDNSTVTFNNIQAPLLFVSSGQINAQVPWELANAQSANVVVTHEGSPSAPIPVQLAPAGPGIFATSSGQAIAYGNSDGAFAAPVGAIGNSHPAKIGDPTTMVILATGLGPVTPSIPTGAVPPSGSYSSTATMPTVTVGGVPAQVVFSGIVGFVGVYQINVVIQPGTPTGDNIPIQIVMNGVKSNTPTISVSN